MKQFSDLAVGSVFRFADGCPYGPHRYVKRGHFLYANADSGETFWLPSNADSSIVFETV